MTSEINLGPLGGAGKLTPMEVVLDIDIGKIAPASPDIIDVLGLQGKGRLRVDDPERYRRIRRSFDWMPPFRSISELRGLWAGERIAIVGGSADIEDPTIFAELLTLAARGWKIAAINKSFNFLKAKGLVPHFGVMSDPKEFVAGYQDPTPGAKFLIGSECHDDTFKRHWDSEVYIWHCCNTETQADGANHDHDFIRQCGIETGQRAVSIEGGSTTGMRSIDLFVVVCGFSWVRLFGFGCSADDRGRMYPYPKPIEDPVCFESQLDDPLTVKLDEHGAPIKNSGKRLAKVYRSTEPMARQAAQLAHWWYVRAHQVKNGVFPPFGIFVHGSGLFPDWAALYGFHADPTRGDKLRALGYAPDLPVYGQTINVIAGTTT